MVQASHSALSEEVYSVTLYCITAFTLIVQCYLLFLIQFKSIKSMDEYRYFLNNLTCCEMLFTIVFDAVVAPSGIPNHLAGVVTGLSKYFRPEFQLFWLGVGFYAGSLLTLMQIQCLVYRFTVIQLDKRIHRLFVSTPSKIIFILGQQSISMLAGVFAYFACVQPEDFPARIWQEETSEIQQILTKHSFFIWFDIERSPKSLWFFGTIVLAFGVVETLFASLIYFIMKTLRKHSKNFSKATYKLHRQFTIILIVQVVSPLLFVSVPVLFSIIIIVVFKTYPTLWISQLGVIWISLYAVSNALFTIWHVSPYRQHLFQLLSCLKIHRRAGSITQIVPQTQLGNITTLNTFTRYSVPTLAYRSTNRL